MIQWVIYTMLGLGSVLMVFNIYGFIRYARYIKGKEYWGNETRILYVPIVLLVMFLLGYLAVGSRAADKGDVFAAICGAVVYWLCRRAEKKKEEDFHEFIVPPAEPETTEPTA